MTAELVHDLYDALHRGDGETMARCYHDDAVFEDPVFGELGADAARDMWRMLYANATDLAVTHELISHTDHAPHPTAEVAWRADYTFGATGRHVTNRVRASMVFRDGLIVDHRDSFDLWRWSRQALGPTGWVLGWSPLIQRRIRRRARRGLDRFRADADAV